MPLTTIIPVFFALIFPAGLLWAAYSDLTSYTIPNRISLALAAGFFPFALLMHLSLSGFAGHVGAGLIMLIVGMALFAMRLFGGGDAKLLAAAALWLGKDASLALLVYTALCGGGLAIILILLRKTLGIYAPKLPKWLAVLLEPNGGVPYGVAIGAGALLAFPLTGLFAQLSALIFS